MHKRTCIPALLVSLAGIALLGIAHADTKNMRIAFSNNYAGNSWRQAMLKSYDIVTKKAVAEGIVAAADVFTTADKEVPTQAAQIQNLILQGYNAIVVNASSPDALNGAIKQATDAAQAFAAAGRKEPIIIMGNRQDELEWWKEQKAKNGYTTWSASIAPGVSTLAFWVAQQILDGHKDIPNGLLVPYLAFDQDNFEAALATIPKGGVASHEYTLEEAKAAIAANMKK
jgi:ABC-type sugar transport system substrate-binding protein